MIKKKMQDVLNRQINAELYSSYLYLSMAAYFESVNLKGFANWMRVQTQEELVHVMKFYDYVIGRGGRVKLSPIDGPPTEWKCPLDVFENTYRHEKKVTGLINKLVNLAVSEKDHATTKFLQWFVDEQVEEEASAQQIVDQLKMIGDQSSMLYMVDKELGTRTFVAEAGGE